LNCGAVGIFLCESSALAESERHQKVMQHVLIRTGIVGEFTPNVDYTDISSQR